MDEIANKHVGEIELTLGGTPRKLTYSGQDFQRIEALLDIRRGERTSFLRFVGQIGAWTTQDFQLMIWAGLHDEAISEEDVGKLLDLSSLLEAQLVFAEWANRMIPESLKKKARDLEAARQSNGKTLGKTE